jgi:UDP-N-acetylglucosamine 4,6-dehydratase
MGSRGSVIPFFLKEKDKGVLPITDPGMTRFMISLEQAVELVWTAFSDMTGGEIYVKKIPSMKVTELASAIAPNARQEFVGTRPGEKLHEQMIGFEDAPFTYEYPEYFKIVPAINHWSRLSDQVGSGKLVAADFFYSSDSNKVWMSKDELNAWLDLNKKWIEEF